jgi:translocon-associated protein subunit alpha
LVVLCVLKINNNKIILLTELPAGQITEFLVGFTNKGNQEMMVESVEAAFHYPMDHSFVIQNFSAFSYAKVVKPQQQATVLYSFIPSEHFAGRPFGLSINLAYRDMVSAMQYFLLFLIVLFFEE